MACYDWFMRPPQRDHHGVNFLMQLHKVSLSFYKACKQELLCSIHLSNYTMGEGERWELTVQGAFKSKNHKQGVTCLGINGLGRGIVGSKSRWDFCNFPQNHLVIVKIDLLFSFWLAVLKALGSQVVFGMVVLFLWIYRYMEWGSWGGKPARLDSH